MRPYTNGNPKALLPVLGRPFVDWQLRHLAANGIDRLTLCIGYGGDALQSYVGDGSRYGMTITWVSEGDDLLGTGGAIRLAHEVGALEDVFFVLYGDSYLPVNMQQVAGAWQTSGLPALMTVMRNDGRWDRSNAVYASGRVVLYEKGGAEAERHDMHWIDYGLSVLTREIIAECVPPGAVADLAEVMTSLSLAGRLAGLEVSGRFYEVGSPQGLEDLEHYLQAAGSAGLP
jgi:NDP-sugar pyrophosphorylase family protein